jgi:uncharacterized protein (TIGR03435 family)
VARILASLNMIALAAGVALGQASGGFEVASIKPSDPSARGSSIGIAPGGILRGRNVTLKSLIQQAYDVRDFQISGGPGWIGTEGYDIEAKGNGPVVSEEDLVKMTDAQRNQFQQQMLSRLRSLLADRFQLKIHQETTEMPVYELIVARSGPKIHMATDNFTPQSGLKMSRSTEGKTEMTATQEPMALLARMLSNQVGRPVLDKTGLKGNYDFKITFAPDLADTDGPSIFTALQEQLGLKLDAQRGPVEVMVIDGAEHASAN